MKIFTVFLGLVLACLYKPANAQLVFSKNSQGEAEASLWLPPSKIIPAASKIKPVTADLYFRQPKQVSLDPLSQLNKAKENCPFLQSRKATLELKGSRSNTDLVQLEWKTTNGIENLGFDVERSFDDTLHFQKIHFVWARSFSGLKDQYDLPDDNSHHKISFYRLKLSLKSGGQLYSNMIKVEGYTREALQVFPNPSPGALSLNLAANADGNAAIKIFDVSGRIVWQQSAYAREGQNSMQLDLARLVPGAYTIKVEMADKTSTTARFLRQ